MLFFKNISVDLEKGDRDKHHMYRFNSETYPGLTTVLGKTSPRSKSMLLDRWRKSEPNHQYITKESIDIGSDTHELIENYLQNKEPEFIPEYLALMHFERMKPILNKINNVCGVEVFLYSKKLRVAGTADCVAEYDGKLSIIDYKTKRKDYPETWLYDHFLQATGYGIMWEEMTGQKIEQVVIIVSSKRGQLESFVKNPDDYREELMQRVGQYHRIVK